jgi:hypothetical protein
MMEYQIALGMCALRAITFPGMSLGGRRLMFLLAGLTLMELNQRVSIQETSPADLTEVFQLPVAMPAEGAEPEPVVENPPSAEEGIIYLPPPVMPVESVTGHLDTDSSLPVPPTSDP